MSMDPTSTATLDDMEDEKEIEQLVTDFMLKTCQLKSHYRTDVLHAFLPDVSIVNSGENRRGFIDTTITGSVAEFYIDPMLPVSGDIDIMQNDSVELAILAGHAPPMTLPSDVYSSEIIVYEMVDSEFPGYVYLPASYLLTLNDDAETYRVMNMQSGVTGRHFRQSEYDCPASSTATEETTESYLPDSFRLIYPNVALLQQTGSADDDGNIGLLQVLFDIDEARKPDFDCEHMIRYLDRPHGPATQRSLRGFMTMHCPHVLRHAPAIVAAMERVTGVEHTMQYKDLVPALRCLTWPVQAAGWPTRRRQEWPDPATIEEVVNSGCDVVGISHHLAREDEWVNRHQWRLSFSRAEVVLLNSWSPVQQIVYHMLRVFLKEQRFTDSNESSSGGEHHLSNYHVKTLMLWACELKAHSWWSLESNSLVKLCSKLLHNLSVWISDKRCQHYFIKNCNLFNQLSNSSATGAFANEFSSFVLVGKLGSWFMTSYVWKCAQCCPPRITSLFLPSGTIHQLKLAVNAIADWRSTLVPCRLHADLVCAQHAILTKLHFDTNVNTMPSWCAYYVKHLDTVCPKFSLYFAAVISSVVAYEIDKGGLTNGLLAILWTLFGRPDDTPRKCGSLVLLRKALSLLKVETEPGSTVQQIREEMSKAYLYRTLRCTDYGSDSVYSLAHALLSVMDCITRQYQPIMVRSGSYRTSDGGRDLNSVSGNIDNVLGLTVLYHYLLTTAVDGPAYTNANVAQYLSTALLVELLTQFAYEQLIEFRHKEEQEFGGKLIIITKEFEALYAYRCGLYETCLQICRENMFRIAPGVILAGFPPLLRLLDDKSASLIGLVTLAIIPAKLAVVESAYCKIFTTQTLLLHLFTECQLKLGSSPLSLIHVLRWITFFHRLMPDMGLLEKLLLVMTYRKIIVHLTTVLETH